MLIDTTSSKWKYIIFIAIALCTIYIIVHGFSRAPISTDHQNNQMVDRQVDSLRTWAKQLQHNLDSSNHRIYTDSIQYTRINNQLAHVPQLIQQIHDKYATQIHHIDTLPVTEQFGLFSEWITGPDSL